VSKQDLFTVWWIGQFGVLLTFLFLPDMTDRTHHGVLFANALVGNVFYLISQNLRDEPDP